MGVLSIVTDTTGQVNVNPRRVKIVTTDSLGTVTTAGYLNKTALSTFPIYPTDIFDIDYAWVIATNSGSYGEFLPTFSNGVITLSQASSNDVLLPTVANNIATYTNTTGQLSENANNALNAISTSSATPGTLRSIIGSATNTATTMTSGNLAGVRGVVNIKGSSTSAFIYGTQGKIIATGTLASGQFQAAVFGQLDISAATINGCQLAALWGDYGTSSGTLTSQTGLYGIAFTNTTAAVPIGQLYLYGGATNLMYLNTNAGQSGTTYFKAAGTSSGSAGYASGCNATEVLVISVNSTTYYIPCFAQNT